MADCNTTILRRNINPSCFALIQKGGLKSDFYAVSLSNVIAFTRDATTRNITGFTLAPDASLVKVSGKKFTNSGTFDLTTGDNGLKLINQAFLGVFYYENQLQKEAIEDLTKVDDLMIIAERNSGGFEVWGVNSANFDDSSGLNATALSGGTGVQLTDGNAIVLTFSGAEGNLPIYGKFGNTRALERAYLDGLIFDAVVVP